MRLLTFHSSDGLSAGFLDGEEVIAFTSDATGLAADPGHDGPSVRTLIALDPAARAAAALKAREATAPLALADLRLEAPLVDPEKIICVGLNYPEHADEAGLERPDTPVLFPKFRNSLIGSAAPIRLPRISDEIDYEGELAVVIARICRDASEAEALAFVGGVMPFNDVSARDLQLRTSQWLPGKALDTFGPSGPFLVTMDEIPDVQNLSLTTKVNDGIVQSETTANMHYSVAELIAHISSLLTLEPGDIIATGTPSGVGFARDPKLYLRDGDTVTVEVSGVGTLTNPVVRDGT
jgi:2-keto-4-pentenoate hydratase/2-oxohepta-3-ene-1,7-dioic acid hydratase in catechol pathway